MQGKRTAVYCRVDRGGNSEMRRDALEMQKRKLEHYAAEKGLPISGYYEDDGFPGHDLNRPGLTRLLKDYHAGVFEQAAGYIAGVVGTNPNGPFRSAQSNSWSMIWYVKTVRDVPSPFFVPILRALLLQSGNIAFEIVSNKIRVEIAKRVQKIINIVTLDILNTGERV